MQRLLYIVLAGIFLLISCQEENWQPKDDLRPQSAQIDAARQYFEDAITRIATKGVKMKTDTWSPGEITPVWEDATRKKDGQYEYLFIPVYAQNQYLAEQRVRKDTVTKYYHVLVSQFLAIRQDKEGKYSMVCFSLIPSKGYYTANKNKVEQKFLGSPSYYGDFTGRIAYYRVADGTLMGADKVNNGIFEWGFWRDSNSSKKQFKANYRKMFKKISVFQILSTRSPIYDGGILEDADVIWCRKCQESVEPGHICPYDEENEKEKDNNEENEEDRIDESWGNEDNDDGDTGESWGGSGGSSNSGSSSGGKGNSTSNQPRTYVKQKGDKFVRGGIPKTVSPQVGSTCVFATMNYVSKILGKEIDDGVFIKLYLILYNENIQNIVENGADASKIPETVSNFFTTENFINYTTAIDRGNVIMTELPIANEAFTHCVAVVGYHPDGTLIYMDTVPGYFMECPSSYPTGGFNIVITGFK